MRAALAWLLLIGVAHAQTTAAPAGTQLNPNRVIIGPLPGQVAGGDALAAEIANRVQAEAIAVVNRPTIAPLTTTVGATATTIYPAGTYVSISIKVTTPGAITTCTGDGGATSGTATYPQDLHWPTIVGGAMPPGPVVCTGQTAISTEAH
jgi:hypothetical protein